MKRRMGAYILDADCRFKKTLKRIIYRMLGFYQRLWRVFFATTPGWVAVAYLFRYYPIPFKSFLIVALICFVVGLIGLYRDCTDSRQKDKEQKKVEVRRALREAVKRLNPEYTEEQIDWWIEGK